VGAARAPAAISHAELSFVRHNNKPARIASTTVRRSTMASPARCTFTAALQGVAIGLVDEHLRHCVMQAADASDADRDDKLTEAVRAVERLVRS